MASLNGKIFLITGSTAGLGLHTARELYRRGATVILTYRDHSKGKAAAEAVQSVCPDAEGRLHMFELDLASYMSVLRFCREVRAHFNCLNVLVCNAGVMGLPFELSTDGVERHFASNYLGHFWLVARLLPLLECAPDPRVVVVSSGLYKNADTIPKIRELMGETLWEYDSRRAYACSKLACCLFAAELARRLSVKKSPVRVFCVRPGFVRGTELGRETHWVLRLLAAPLIWLVAKNLDQGIATIMHCATVIDENLESGKFYGEGAKEEPYTDAVHSDAAQHLWAMSQSMEEMIVKRTHTLSQEDRDDYEKLKNF